MKRLRSSLLFVVGLVIGLLVMYAYTKNTEKPSGNEKRNAEGLIAATNFSKIDSKPISLNDAKEYVKNYMNVCLTAGQRKDTILRALSVDSSAINHIFSDKRCIGLRLYFAKRTEGVPLVGDYTLVVVGYDAKGNNITSDIWDECSPCPNDCPDVQTDLWP